MKALSLFLILVSITLSSNIHSQVYREWVQRYGRTGDINDNPRRVGIDRNGNIICVNNPQPGTNADIDILKYDQSGTNLWIQPYNGIQNENDYVEMFHIDDSSNVFIGGSENQASAGQATDPYMIKYNSAGTMLWNKSFNPINEYGHVSQMQTDASGNIYFVGDWGNFTPNIDVVTRTLTPGGVQTWTDTWVVPGQREDGTCILRDAEGNIIIAGGYNLSTSTDIFVRKYSSSGTVLWSATFNGPDNKADYVYSDGLALDNNGNVYIFGIVNNNDIWAHGGNFDEVLLKYSSSGVLQWTRYINGSANEGDYPSGIVIDPQNNIYITGDTKEISSMYDGFLAKYNTTGDLVWVEKINSETNKNDGLGKPVLDKFGNIYIGGYIENPGSDGICQKYNSDGTLIWSKSYNNIYLDSLDYFQTPAIDSSGNVFCIGGSYYTGYGIDMVLVKYLQPPYTPVSLTAAAESSSRIELNWSDESGNEAGFKIEHSSNAGTNWILIDSTAADKTTYIDSNLTGNSVYYYRVYGFNNAGSSPFSNTASDTTFSIASKLDLTILLEGFYNAGLNTSVQDTIRVYLHNNSSPFNIVDSSMAYLSSEGTVSFMFSIAEEGTPYFIKIKHRNALETWSKSPGQSFSSSYLSFDFTTEAEQAYGNNMIQVDNSPVLFALYCGDSNQDGVIDGTDGVLIDNDAAIFKTGYLPTDLNGDEVIDGSDAVIADNNAANFVSAVTP